MNIEIKKSAFIALLFLAALTGCQKVAGEKSEGNAPKPPEGKVYADVPSSVMVSKLKGLDEKQFSLDEYKGKTVLVNFWATWCGPCKQEIPELIKIVQEYKEKDFVVIGLNGDDEPPAAVKSFVENQQIDYRIGWTTPELQTYFRPRGIPASYIINREGKLVAAFTGFNPNTTPKKLRQVIDDTIAQ